MAEYLLDDADVDLLLKQEGGGRVPGVVDAPGVRQLAREGPVGAETLCRHQAIFMNHASGAVVTPDAKVI